MRTQGNGVEGRAGWRSGRGRTRGRRRAVKHAEVGERLMLRASSWVGLVALISFLAQTLIPLARARDVTRRPLGSRPIRGEGVASQARAGYECHDVIFEAFWYVSDKFVRVS